MLYLFLTIAIVAKHRQQGQERRPEGLPIRSGRQRHHQRAWRTVVAKLGGALVQAALREPRVRWVFVALRSADGDHAMGKKYITCRRITAGRSGIGRAFFVGNNPTVRAR